jgi:hypothetical protein
MLMRAGCKNFTFCGLVAIALLAIGVRSMVSSLRHQM